MREPLDHAKLDRFMDALGHAATGPRDLRDERKHGVTVIAEGPFAWLPAGSLLERGLQDLERGVRSVPAVLVAMAWPRLAPLCLASKALADGVRVPGEDLELESALNALEREARKREGSVERRP